MNESKSIPAKDKSEGHDRIVTSDWRKMLMSPNKVQIIR